MIGPDVHWPLPEALPALEAGTVHVWRAHLAQPDGVVRALSAHLSPEEEFRACGYQRDLDRRRFIVCRGLLRRLLGAYTATAPGHLAFRLGCQGKPQLAGGAPRLRFNVSHSEDLALFAVTAGREVGVDLEHVRPLVEAGAILAQFFSEREKEALLQLPEPAQLPAFFRCWTRKEAYVKARACEPDLVLPDIDVDFQSDRLAANALRGSDASNWFVAPLEPLDGFIGALAVEGPDCAIARYHLAVG